MKYIIPILFFNLLLCQDIGQKMFKNGDTDSAIKYYQHLLEDEDLLAYGPKGSEGSP